MKHNNLLNYFIHDKRDLSPAYVRSCEKFLKEISAKHQAASFKHHEKDTIEWYKIIRKIYANKRS